MKKNIIIAVCLLLSIFGNAQCDTPYVSYSTLSHSVCLDPTYNIGQVFSKSLHITATGANSYTWNINGVDSVYANYFDYVPTVTGPTTIIIIGSYCGLSDSSTFILEAVACDYTSLSVGINQYRPEQSAPIYLNLQGQRVTPTKGILLIEQVGTVRKKIIICD